MHSSLRKRAAACVCAVVWLRRRWKSVASKFVYTCRLHTEELLASQDPVITRLMFAQVSTHCSCSLLFTSVLIKARGYQHKAVCLWGLAFPTRSWAH